MGNFRYRINSANFEPLISAESPDGWKDDESTFPRSPNYFGIFRKFSANVLTFNQTGAERLRAIFSQNSFESEATFSIYENNIQGYTGEFLRFKGDFNFVDYENIDGNEGRTVEIPVVDSMFWRRIKSREDDKPQLLPVPNSEGIRTTLDGFQYTGFTNEETFITLPSRTILATGTLDANNKQTTSGDQSVPLAVSSQVEGGGAINVVNRSAIDNINGAFFVANGVNSLEIEVQYETQIELQAIGGDPFATLKLKHYNSVDVQQNPSTDELETISGNNGDIKTLTAFTSKTFPTVNDGDYFILSVEGTFANSNKIPSPTTPYLAFVITRPNVDNVPEIEISGMLLHEAVSRLITLISNTDTPLYSELLGRTNSEPRTYASNGELSELLITNGERIRQFDSDEAPIALGFQDIFNSLNSLMPIGAGIEIIDGKDTLRIEKRRYFFDDRVVLVVENPIDKKESVLKSEIINRIEVGYNKALYEQKDGLFEYNQKSNFSSPISVIKNTLNIKSAVRADDQAIGNARAKDKANFPTEDTRYDKDNFFIDLVLGENKIINGNFNNWTDDNTPNDWIIVGGVVERKFILNSDRCYFKSGPFGVAQIKQQYAGIVLNEKLNIKFNYENIGNTVLADPNFPINPAITVTLDAGANVYQLQSAGTWLISATQTFIYIDTNVPATPENELQSLRTFSMIIDDLPESGDVSLKIISVVGLILDDVYMGASQYKARTDEGFVPGSITGAINGSDSLNLRRTPARNIREQGSEIRASLENKLSQLLTFNSSSKSSTLSTQLLTESEPIAETDNILVSDLSEPYFKPIKREFGLEINKDVIDILNETFPSETKPKYLGIIKFWDEQDQKYVYVWIDDIQTGGQSGIGKAIGREVNLDYVTPIEI